MTEAEMQKLVGGGILLKNALLDGTKFRFNGCLITLHGIAPTGVVKNPRNRVFLLYEDAQNWLCVDGTTKRITTRGRAKVNGNAIQLDQTHGTVVWE